MIRALVILTAMLPAGCALTPQATQNAHPEAQASGLSAKEQYLQECADRIHMTMQKVADRVWETRREPRPDEGGPAKNEVLTTFEILSDGQVENLQIQSVKGLKPEGEALIRNIFAHTHLPPMPPEVAAETGGRLADKVWVNEWVY